MLIVGVQVCHRGSISLHMGFMLFIFWHDGEQQPLFVSENTNVTCLQEGNKIFHGVSDVRPKAVFFLEDDA